jgi:hypothetical protein
MSEPASSPKCELCGATIAGNGVCPRRQFVDSNYAYPPGCAKYPSSLGAAVKDEPGSKFDGDKIRTDLLPVEALEGVSAVLSYGSKKYGDRNWEKGMSYSRPYAACLRHLFAWWRGEDIDPETGLSHLDHALCCLLFLSTFVKRRVTTFDDRPHFRG